VLTFFNTFAWAHFKQLSLVLAMEHPGSHRAAVTAILNMPYQGEENTKHILQVYEKAYRAAPNDLGRILQRLALKCRTKTITQGDISETISSLKQAHFSNTASQTIDILSILYKDNGCHPLNKRHLNEIIHTLIETSPTITENSSPRWKKTLHKLYRRLAILEMDDQHILPAIKYLDKANKIHPFPPSLVILAEWLTNDDQHTKALEYINQAEQIANKEVLPYLPNPYTPLINTVKNRIQVKLQRNNTQ
jgi:tetratricopeptide (TPR) repeat protein